MPGAGVGMHMGILFLAFRVGCGLEDERLVTYTFSSE